MSEKDDRLVAFLYTLMRDDVVVGRVNELVRDLSTCRLFELSDQDVAAIARRHAATLTEYERPAHGEVASVEMRAAVRSRHG